MSRLTAAHRAAERLRAHGLPQHRAELDVITLALGRMAQLEKVAELAREATTAAVPDRALYMLDLALTALDYPGDTPGPHARALDALTSPAAEAASRAAWSGWRDQRGPGVTEEG